MIQRILQLFDKPVSEAAPIDAEKRVRVATCALLVELAQSDSDFSEVEKEEIVEILCGHYGLSEEDAEEVIAAAREELDDTVQLWRFTNLINQNFSNEEKLGVIEMVWRVIYADGKLDRYEDYLVHRLAKLLNLTHRQMIDAKVQVLQETPSD